MNFEISYATEKDASELNQQDDLPIEMVKKCICNRQYIVAKDNHRIFGFLRFTMFWHEIPYMEMIRVLSKYQGQGLGSALFQFWEVQMKGAKLLMTSSESDEKEPQAWHKRNGFKQAGTIMFEGLQKESEMFFVKRL